MWHLVRLIPQRSRRRSPTPCRGLSSVISGEKFGGFAPGREWVPLDPGRIDKGEARRTEAKRRRRRWERSRRRTSGAAIEVVCHGNIARSQSLPTASTTTPAPVGFRWLSARAESPTRRNIRTGPNCWQKQSAGWLPRHLRAYHRRRSTATGGVLP